MTISRIDLHPLGGIAGDMFAAAAFDACPELYDSFQQDLAQLPVTGLSTSLEAKLPRGLAAKHFKVLQSTQDVPPRTLQGVVQLLGTTAIEAGVVDAMAGIYTCLAEAEAAVHGKTIETIHFHEVSDWDSMVDILAAAGVIARLNCKAWRIGALPLGGGTITTAHGDIPLPAPATMHLLNDYVWFDDGQPGERVTPTGAAIVAYLKPVSMSAGSAACLTAVGVGCGTREIADRANILRLSIFKTQSKGHTVEDTVCRLSFEIDDMTAEELAHALDTLRIDQDVLDASSVAMQGKKGRHVVGVRLLVLPDAKDRVIDQCFLLCSTLGVRHQEVSRTTLKREHITLDEKSAKVAFRSNTLVTAKSESDDLSGAGSLHERRQQAMQIEQAALAKNKQRES